MSNASAVEKKLVVVKASDPFGHIPSKKAPIRDEDALFFKQVRPVRKSLDGLDDDEALAEIFLTFASERQRMTKIGALTPAQALADIRRTVALLEKLVKE